MVGRLTRTKNKYSFVYTRGAAASSKFIPFGRMTDLRKEYESTELLPFFSNRVLTKSRPEYAEFLRWLDLDDSDPLLQLARTGGLKGTDSISVYPAPTPDKNGDYRVVFFCHGMRYTGEPSLHQAIQRLRKGDQLFPMHDMQNPWDRDAIALRSDDPATLLGYCPRFFAKDFGTLLGNDANRASVTVVRANLTAPIEYRLLCEFKAHWPTGFVACEGDEFESLARRQVKWI